jgi:hypothetical protein
MCGRGGNRPRGATEIVRNRKREVAESVYYLESLEGQLEAARARDDVIAVRQELSSTVSVR